MAFIERGVDRNIGIMASRGTGREAILIFLLKSFGFDVVGFINHVINPNHS